MLKSTILIILLLNIFFSQAQNLTNKNNMESLANFEGDWIVENYILENEIWELIGTTNSKIILEYEGRFVSEKVTYLTKYGEINMITHIGYDARLKKFKLSAKDKEYGYMDIYFGDWINDELIFTNLESDIPILFEDGKTLSFRLTYSAINKQSFTHTVEGTYDKGKTWFVFSKANFKRN